MEEGTADPEVVVSVYFSLVVDFDVAIVTEDLHEALVNLDEFLEGV